MNSPPKSQEHFNSSLLQQDFLWSSRHGQTWTVFLPNLMCTASTGRQFVNYHTSETGWSTMYLRYLLCNGAAPKYMRYKSSLQKQLQETQHHSDTEAVCSVLSGKSEERPFYLFIYFKLSRNQLKHRKTGYFYDFNHSNRNLLSKLPCWKERQIWSLDVG